MATALGRIAAEDTETLHQASLEILQETGMDFHHPEALRILQDHDVRVVGQRAFFEPDQIMQWIRKAPAEFTLYARNPAHDMRIGGDRTLFAPGYGAPAVIEADGTRRRACLQDYLTFVKLFHQSPLFKINGGILVQPGDLPPEHATVLMFFAALTHTDKCLLGIPADTPTVEATLDMLAICFGGREALRAKPRMTTIINTLSPLGLDRGALATLLAYARCGQPVIVTPGVMAGTTGPVTLAGTMVQANAETLAGIVLAQMVRPGTPAVYGCQATAADMRTGAYAVGCPEHALCVAAGARLAKFYNLPCRGGGTPTDALSVSVQAGYEAMLVMMASCTSGVNLVIHTAGILDAHGAMSFEKFIVDLDIAAMAARFAGGIQVDADSLATDIIRQVGPGGEFLTLDHTLSHCRGATLLPEIGIRGQAPGDPNTRLANAITRKKDGLLAEYQCPALPSEILFRLHAYLAARGVRTDYPGIPAPAEGPGSATEGQPAIK